MKKILMSLLVLTMVSTTTLADTGKGTKKAKAKKECIKNCAETRDCKKTAKCPNRPGCICQ